MRPPTPARSASAIVFTALLLAGCTSSPTPGAVTSGPPGPNGASTSTASSATPSPTGDRGAFELTAARVSIRPPNDGSFRVRGVYPWHPSHCVHPIRPTLGARYPGALSIRTADDGTLTVTVTLPFDRYLEGIAEVPPTWPMAALQAQVIAARSYVLSRTGWTGAQGETLDTPICGTSACQVYGGIPHPRPPGLNRWYRAVRDTRGQVLLSDGRPADTVYFSTSNGHTYGNEDVFGSPPLPYLRPVIERDDGASPLSHWHVEMPFGDLATVLRAAGAWPHGTPITSASVVGSAVQVRGGGESGTIAASTLRDDVNTSAPCVLPRRYPSGGLPATIPSGWFGMSAGAHALVVDGRGWGHGVGMVQWGAYGKARRGWTASRILAFYYGGLTPRRIREPGTVLVTVASGLRSLTVDPSGRGATIAGQELGRGKLRISGGDEVTVSS
jgi:stage II sporulation protein D